MHRLRGQPSARRKPPQARARALARYAEERYADFGPTLMAEHLLKEKLVVDHETLRRWRLAEGTHTVRRRQQKHRQWRERKPSFGAMVQLDGSHHDWFEGRAPKCVLMVMVDDATNRMRARFFAEETTRASYDVLEGWVRQHGLPGSLYVDRNSIYRCEGVGSIAEQLAGKLPQTQFERAMEALGVELILAHSPQAKGRVERRFGTLQNRLVALLAYEKVSRYATAQLVLDREIQRQNATVCRITGLSPNAAWEKALGEQRAVTRPCPPATLLDLHLALHLKRRVNADHQIDFLGRSWPIAPTKRSAITLIHHPLRQFWVVTEPPCPPRNHWPEILGKYSL